MAHGYTKASGKPMAVMVHGTVGLQHASMALYNAWCDRVPMLMFGGNGIGVEWIHSAQDPAALVREFIKWDDQPASLQHFAESTVRAHQFAMTAPMALAFIAIDMDLQEEEIEHAEKLKIPLLMLMHNNRCQHQEIMHVQRMAAIHNRPQATARIGTEITGPNIDFAKLAQGMGVWAEGPITDPAKLGASLRRALDVVKQGRPALLDVICQPR